MNVTILGAGIVGLASAWELHLRGHRVTVVDRAPSAGAGASGGNGAQLSYSYVQPLADASIWGQLPRLLLEKDSPLTFRLRMDPAQWRWGMAFMAACNDRTSRETTAQLLTLAARSRIGFEAMRTTLNPDCDFAEAGKLVIYRGAPALDAARHQVEMQAALGSAPQRIVAPDECVAIEPALAAVHGDLAGAVYTPSECVVDSLKLCAALAEALRTRGMRFEWGQAIDALRVETKSNGSAPRIVAARTPQGDIGGDAFVLALGAQSAALVRPLGVRLPVYPLKGYSLTLDVRPAPGAAPRTSITDAAHKVVYARIGERLRVAGMAELVGHDLAIDQRRITSLVRATRTLFPECTDWPAVGEELAPGQSERWHAWAGLRPVTPTARPILGRVGGAPRNLLMNVGQGALGLTLAFGSAARVADAVEASG